MQSPPKYSPQETAERGMRWYDNGLRRELEVEENLGKILALDVDTGQYAMGTEVLDTVSDLKAKLPEADILLLRIGYPAVHTIGGGMRPYEQFRK